MAASFQEERRPPTVLLGAYADPNRVTGMYGAFRCGKCTDVHVTIIGTLLETRKGKGAVQIAMTAAEARQLAAELLALAEEH
jgi:hypothetical protein